MKRSYRNSTSERRENSLQYFKAPNLNEVVNSLKESGIKAIRKRRFRLLGEERVPDCYWGKTSALEEPEVEPPDFWVPIGFDGSAWQVFLCVPPWLEEDPIAASWYLTWRDQFKVGSTAELTNDHEHFVHDTLVDLATPVHTTWHLNEMSKQEISACDSAREESLALLQQAMEEAHRLDQSNQPCCDTSQVAGNSLPLSNQIAMVMELAFRAGIHYERMAWYGRNVPGVARKGMPLVTAQKSNSGPRLKWTEKAEELMRETPQIKVRDLAIRLAEMEVVFSLDDWDTVDFEDGTPSKSFAVFSRAVSRIRSRLKKL